MYAKGVRFNSKRKLVDKYFSTDIWEFYMFCKECKTQMIIKTDPQKNEYILVQGAKKYEQTYQPHIEFLSDQEKEKRDNNVMYKLEKKNKAEKNPQLDDLIMLKVGFLFQEKQKNDFQLNSILRKKFRENNNSQEDKIEVKFDQQSYVYKLKMQKKKLVQESIFGDSNATKMIKEKIRKVMGSKHQFNYFYLYIFQEMKLYPLLCLIVICICKNSRPSHVQPELYCNSCQAMVREALKKLKNKRGEADVYEAIDNLCSPRNYPDYMYPPPDMGKGCQAFIANHEEDLEKVLYNRDFKNPEEWLCNEISEACVGVNVENAHQNKPQTINFNNEEIPVNEDGTVNFGQREEFQHSFYQFSNYSQSQKFQNQNYFFYHVNKQLLAQFEQIILNNSLQNFFYRVFQLKFLLA